MNLRKILLEGKIDDIYAKYYAQSIPERETFNKIIAIDPTFNPEKDKMGQYGQWLLALYKKGEDLFGEESEFKDQIEIFNKSKNKLPQDKRDIMRLKSLKELIDLNAEFEERSSKSQLQLSAEQHPGARFITKKGNWEVYCPETYEASKFLRGDDAVWCTGRHNDDSYYKSYTRDGGKLYIFIDVTGGTDNRNKKYQVSIRNGRVHEFRDARNESADFMQFISDSGLFEVLGDTEIAETKDYKAVKEVKDTNGVISYSKLMAIKYSSGTEQSQMYKVLNTFIHTIIVNDGLKMIIAHCFKDMGITKVVLPNSVQSLGEGCFENCTNLTEITIPEKVTSIPYRCFAGCTSLKTVNIGINMIDFKGNAFKDCSADIKIVTPHHRINLLKSELDWYKSHISWSDDKKEESLNEDFTQNIPSWMKPWIKPFRGNNSTRVSNGYNSEYVSKQLLDRNINIASFEAIEIPVPKDKNDPIFSDPNKILIFFIPAENAEMYRSNKNWGRYTDGDILYIKDVNSPKQGYYAQDEISRRTPLQLIKMSTKMAYIDKTNPNNFVEDKRISRHNNKQASNIERDLKRGQRHESSWVLHLKPGIDTTQYSDKYFNTKRQATNYWDNNEYASWRSSLKVQDIYEYPVQEWRWEEPEVKRYSWQDKYDQSGFNVTLARHQLDVRLNDYKKHNYQRTLDNLRSRLENIRKQLVDSINSSLSDITSIDVSSSISRLMGDFQTCAQSYTKIIARLDYIEQMDNPEEQEKELDNLFSFDKYSRGTFGITVKMLDDDIKDLEKRMGDIETAYIESLRSPKKIEESLSLLNKIK